MTRYLFLCAEGQQRSPTAATVARRLAARQGWRLEADSGGINYVRPAAVPDLQARYDRYIVMEQYMADRLVALGVELTRITVLDIPDHYERGAPDLTQLLEEQLAKVLQ